MNYPTDFIRTGFVFLALGVSLQAETLVQYTFGTSSSTMAATTSGTDVITASFARGAGLSSTTYSTAAGAPLPRSIFVTSAQVDEGISASSTDWLGFTISPTSGNTLKLSELSFYYAYSNTVGTITGTAFFDVRSSVDGYASSIASYSLDVVNSTTPNWALASIGLTAMAYQNLDTVSFRIFLNDGENDSTNSQLRLDTVTLSGVSDVTVVPEPSSYALLGGFGALLIVGARRRRRAV